MKLSEKLKAEREYVQRVLADKVICNRRLCGATLATFADRCGADLNDPCPGYCAIEEAKTEFNRNWDTERPRRFLG